MRRPNRTVAGLCIVIIALSAFLPGVSALAWALAEPTWVLLPDDTPLDVCITATPCDERPVSLLALLPSRAPPSSPLA